MSRYIFIVVLLTFQFAQAQDATIIKFDKLESLLNSKASDILVINFWATWCGPCIKELPLFEKLNAKKDPGVKIVLVNLDYADQIDKVNSFIARKKIKSPVLLLDEVDYNAWIDKVDTSWEGAIPATLILNTKTGQRKFIAREIADGDLETHIQTLRTEL